MVRRHAVVLSVLLAPVLAGCSDDPAIGSDRADLAAAIAVWSDPWVAPTSATVAGPALGSNGQVDRVVGRRTTPYAVEVPAAAAQELRAARAAGWAPTSSTCGDTVHVALAGPGDAAAQLTVAPDGAGAEVAVQAVTAHHLDETWAVPASVERTCLDGESAPFEPPPLGSAPLGDAEASDEESAEWTDDDAPGELVEEVNADPALAALGVRVASPRLETGVNRRRAPAAEVTTGATTLDEVLTVLPGWRPTFAACGGGGGTLATFVRNLGSATAVVTAEVGPEGTSLRVTLPIAEAPAPTWLEDLRALEQPACRGDVSRHARRTTGTPAVLPSDLTPLAG
ncbi:hypothetical protein [Nocardioides sp. SYSU D00065]|uniref:hypothetical protein n=1 Tax=Nocardioides sp. SYSU D00065 TaxID=2817378 RepID=UPI001B32268E|nr:hypothetical protein [Nocardioides sp. SYSU D00065]